MHVSWPPAIDPRYRTLAVRVSDNEYARVRSDAEAAGITLSAYVRLSLLKPENPLRRSR